MSKVANAGAITRLLKSNGFERAEWRRVGVSTANDGFLTEQDFYGVFVSWLFAGYHRDLTADEVATVEQRLTEIADTLAQAGYAVRLRSATVPYLEVIKSN